VAKRLRFFSTFSVLPCLFLCRHDLVRQSAEKLEEPVSKRHNESEESTEERRKRGPGVVAQHKKLAQGLADLVRVNGKEIKSVLYYPAPGVGRPSGQDEGLEDGLNWSAQLILHRAFPHA
jgi:hypothetical protein